VVGGAALVGNHAYQLIAFHFRLEGAAHAAIGAGGHHAVLRLARFDHGLLHQGGGGAGLDTGATGYAFGIHEGFALAGGNPGVKTPAVDGQGKGALDFLTGANTAGADDALAGVEAEIGVGAVGFRIQVVFPVGAVANFPQTHGSGHILQLTVAVGGAGEAVQGVVRDIQLHDIAA